MSHLRFTPDEYHVMRRLVRAAPLSRMDLLAFKCFLVANLPLNHLDLARRVDRLEDDQMRLLNERLVRPSPADAGRGEWDAFTEVELEAVADAWGSFPYPNRFLRHFPEPLVHLVSDGFPGLAEKLAGLNERQFRLLLEYLRGRREGSA
jgi:hypothetical protein